MGKSRDAGDKARRRQALVKNEKARYEKLLKEQPNHKDAAKWKSSLDSIK